MSKTDQPPFRVVEESPACETCGCGTLYTVVYEDPDLGEIGIGKSWGGKADDDGAKELAQECADDLNFGYSHAIDVDDPDGELRSGVILDGDFSDE